MKKDNPNSVYIFMMVDSLKRKVSILREIQSKTKEQEQLLKSQELDEDRFFTLIENKGRLIEEIEEMDFGFDALFKRVEDEIRADKKEYADEILKMKECIKELTDLNVSIQALEHQNEQHFKVYLANSRQEIKDFNVNQRTASTYMQNMTNVHRPQNSYFFNETK